MNSPLTLKPRTARTRRGTFTRVLSAGVLAVALGCLAPAPAAIAQSDPNLVQTVDRNEVIAPAGEQVAITEGHLDFGPLVTDQGMELMFRDDTNEPPVWRQVNDAVIVLDAAAEQTMPDRPEFKFLGATPGSPVWVIPQAQKAEVPWLGWNTQAPSFLDTQASGATFTYLGHEGPGNFSMFIQSGGFGAPTVLFDSQQAAPQDFWVPSQTHMHANWVFTEPGMHEVTIGVSTPEQQGGTYTLRFQVGDTGNAANAGNTEAANEAANESAAEGAAAPPQGSANQPAQKGAANSGASQEARASESSGGYSYLWIGVGLLVLAVIIVALNLVVRSSRGKRS